MTKTSIRAQGIFITIGLVALVFMFSNRISGIIDEITGRSATFIVTWQKSIQPSAITITVTNGTIVTSHVPTSADGRWIYDVAYDGQFLQLRAENTTGRWVTTSIFIDEKKAASDNRDHRSSWSQCSVP